MEIRKSIDFLSTVPGSDHIARLIKEQEAKISSLTKELETHRNVLIESNKRIDSISRERAELVADNKKLDADAKKALEQAKSINNALSKEFDKGQLLNGKVCNLQIVVEGKESEISQLTGRIASLESMLKAEHEQFVDYKNRVGKFLDSAKYLGI